MHYMRSTIEIYLPSLVYMYMSLYGYSIIIATKKVLLSSYISSDNHQL